MKEVYGFKEACEVIVQILAMADGGCSHCVFELVKHMEEEYPDFPWRERAHFYMDLPYEERERLPHQRFDECRLADVRLGGSK